MLNLVEALLFISFISLITRRFVGFFFFTFMYIYTQNINK